MARILLVGADATPQDRQVLSHLGEILQGARHEPLALGLDTAAPTGTDLLRSVQSADALIAVLDRLDDPGLAFTLGVARSSRRPILGLRSDPREGFVPAPLRSSLQDLRVVQEWGGEDVRGAVLQFASGVRVFAGALVRDAVPKILKDEGRELRFRQVAETEYPQLLKRKLVETAQRLEESEFGVEQEEIADVLELLET
ncbi:MAG: hypothetical protein ACREID_03040, partial [Planctomycetota bacterium]